jgi:hypothetical protein
MGDVNGGPQETAAGEKSRLRRRAEVLRELAEARALRKRLRPRKAKLDREREVVNAATLRR